jgi:hypothetical protein
MSRPKKQLSDYSSAKRFWMAVVFVVSLGIVVAGEYDLQRRPAEQVRGNKLFWRVACLNALGAAGYFRWGRLPVADMVDK